MRYLLLIHSDENHYEKLSEQENTALMDEYRRFSEEVTKAGAYKAADRLRPTTSATTVRIRNGKVMATDGPFAETKEQLGGYYMIDVKNLDEAIEWAAKIPTAKYGCVEVRPVWE